MVRVHAAKAAKAVVIPVQRFPQRAAVRLGQPAAAAAADAPALTGLRISVAVADMAKTLAIYRDLFAFTVEENHDLGKVSLIGAGMRSHPGVAARMFRTLADNRINLQMISTSPIKISCMIARSEIPNAVRALHAAFELENEPISE